MRTALYSEGAPPQGACKGRLAVRCLPWLDHLIVSDSEFLLAPGVVTSRLPQIAVHQRRRWLDTHGGTTWSTPWVLLASEPVPSWPRSWLVATTATWGP